MVFHGRHGAVNAAFCPSVSTQYQREPRAPAHPLGAARTLLRCSIFLFFAALLTGCGRDDESRDFLIFAAADLRFAMDELAAQFQAGHPEVAVKTVYGSSGKFYSQIVNGAPFDVYCSADIEYPRRLAAEGFAAPDSEFRYAAGRIVLWVPQASPLQIEQLGIDSLRDPSIRHVAIANPDHAPYGRAAVAAMQSLNVYDSIRSKLAYGESVSQALQYVQYRSADIGIVALSLALAPAVRPTGRYWELPLDSYPRMEQGGIIAKRSRHPAVAAAFRTFVLSPRAQETLKRYGFYLP
jgi:molybdate transport system substrate-binding protein